MFTGFRGRALGWPGRIAGILALLLAAGAVPAAAQPVVLSASDVSTLINTAALALGGNSLAIAVVDRTGEPLGVFSRAGATLADEDRAVGLARTGAFFSHDEAPLSSRTVTFISRPHFPPGVNFTASGPLFGIEHTNRGCDLNLNFILGQDFPQPNSLAGGNGTGTGPVTKPGGVPLYKQDPGTGRFHMVGGIGVSGAGTGKQAHLAHEFAAFSALANGFFPPIPKPGVIFLEGFQLPFVKQTTRPAGFSAGSSAGAFTVGPMGGNSAPRGWLVGPNSGSILTASDVQRIVNRARRAARKTRAAIRLPIGARSKMAISVADTDGTILGLFRMPDATVFSVEVAVSKARNVVWFSSNSRPASDLPGVPPGTAVSNRTIGFGSQPFFPSGIDGTGPGPFRPLFDFDAANPCTQGSQAPNANQSGVVFFPGSTPLYINGNLVGGLGVSGDGVDQDDVVTAQGAKGFRPPRSLRASKIVIDGVRLPFWKFPRKSRR